MKNAMRMKMLICLLVLSVLVLTACGVAQESSQAVQEAAASPLAVLDQLDLLEEFYSINNVAQVMDFGCEGMGGDGWLTLEADPNGLFALCQQSVRNGQALLFDFVFTDAFESADDAFQLMFADYAGDTESAPALELAVVPGGITATANGRPAAKYKFDGMLDWEAGVRYSIFLMVDENGYVCLDLWKSGSPKTAIHVSTVPDGDIQGFPAEPQEVDLQFGIWLPGKQSITIEQMWILSREVDSQAGTQVEIPVEGQEAEPESEPETSIPNLEQYLITENTDITELTCESGAWMVDGVISWNDGMKDACDLTLEKGYALIFDFAFTEEMDINSTDFGWELNSDSDPSVSKGLHAILKQQNLAIVKDNERSEPYDQVDYDREMDWQAGTNYTIVMILEESGTKRVSIWPSDNPEMAVSARISEDEWQQYFSGAVEDDVWQFGIGLMSGQRVIARNMKVLKIQALDVEHVSSEAEQQHSSAPDLAEVDLSNLNGYQVKNVSEITNLVCEHPVEVGDGTFAFGSPDDWFSGYCDLTLESGKGLMFDFTFSEPMGENNKEAVWNFMSNLSSQGAGVKEFNVNWNFTDLCIKMDQDFITSEGFGDDGFSLEPDRSFTIAMIMEEDESVQMLIWPTDEPQNVASARYESEDLQAYFNGSISEESWQFGYWFMAGQHADVQNMRMLELEGSFTRVESANPVEVNQDENEGELDDEILFKMNEYYIPSFSKVENLQCNGTVNETDLIWAAEGSDVSGSCDLSLTDGQALVFEFDYGYLVEGSEGRLAWSFISDEGENVKEIGIDLFNQKAFLKKNGEIVQEFDFDITLDWMPETHYKLLVTSSGMKEIKIWAVDEPGRVASAVIESKDLFDAFGENRENESWQFGCWMMDGIATAISEIYLLEVH